jgi:hypothetical protein
VKLSTHSTSPSGSPPFSSSPNSLPFLYWVGSGEEVVETDMCHEGKKKQRKMFQDNYVWRRQK